MPLEGLILHADASINGVLSFGFSGTNAAATCWGKCQTSRATARDIYEAVHKRVMDAQAQEVTITGEDWEEWSMDGPQRYAEPGDSWIIEFEEDSITYYEKEKTKEELGNKYYLTGTFNDWQYEEMEEDRGNPGLHTANIPIGASLEEQFQIVADKEPHMTFYPETAKCMWKSSHVLGPEDVTRDITWRITGEASDTYRVEFYVSQRGNLSVNWMKE